MAESEPSQVPGIGVGEEYDNRADVALAVAHSAKRNGGQGRRRPLGPPSRKLPLLDLWGFSPVGEAKHR